MIKKINKKILFRLSLILASFIGIFLFSSKEKTLKSDNQLNNNLSLQHLSSLSVIEKVYADDGDADGGDADSSDGDHGPPAIYHNMTVSFTADSYTVPYGGSTIIRWGSTAEGIADPRYCQAWGDWSGIKDASQGSESTGALYSPATYNIQCVYYYFPPGGDSTFIGYSNQETITINVAAPITPTVQINFQ